MKKIGILTHYSVNNQGALLQLYALYSFLTQSGHEPYVLIYEKNFDFADNDVKKRYSLNIASYGYFIKQYLIKQGFGITWFNFRKNRMLNAFRRNFRFCQYDDPSLDLVIVGSDEVFSIPVGINKMMCGYGINAKSIIAYAPSFGQTDIDLLEKHTCSRIISDGIKTFKSEISSLKHKIKELYILIYSYDKMMVC